MRDPELLQQAVEALRRLEAACEALAATRSQAIYDAMIAAGQGDLLTALDDARRAARSVLSSVGHLPEPPIREGYGVKVRKAQVRAMAGRESVMMDEWQVWKTDRRTGRYCIYRRFQFQSHAEAEASAIRAIRKREGMTA